MKPAVKIQKYKFGRSNTVGAYTKTPIECFAEMKNGQKIHVFLT